MEIDNHPVADSLVNDAFEAIVELYFQLEGFITSTGKWFWVRDTEKSQRGYQDIDVLAVGGNQTIIVSVSTNLDDKVAGSGVDKLCSHFERVRLYLETVPSYKWMVAEGREVSFVLAYLNENSKRHLDKIKSATVDIRAVGAKEMLDRIDQYLKANRNIKIQNWMLRLVQVQHQSA
jgi:hypothetical protein